MEALDSCFRFTHASFSVPGATRRATGAAHRAPTNFGAAGERDFLLGQLLQGAVDRNPDMVAASLRVLSRAIREHAADLPDAAMPTLQAMAVGALERYAARLTATPAPPSG